MHDGKQTEATELRLALLIVLSSIVLFGAIFLLSGFNELSLRSNIRWSARVSLICFCLAFMASSIRKSSDNAFSRWAIRNRRQLGISFAIIHLIHLMFLVTLHRCFYQVFTIRPPIITALGGIAFLFLILMLLTSFPYFKNKVSPKKWKLLHKTGGYYILIVFSNSIIGRIVAGEYAYLPLGLLIVVVWVVRVLEGLKK